MAEPRATMISIWVSHFCRGLMSFFNCTNKDTKEVPWDPWTLQNSGCLPNFISIACNIESTCEPLCLVCTFHLRPLDIDSTQLLDTRTPQWESTSTRCWDLRTDSKPQDWRMAAGQPVLRFVPIYLSNRNTIIPFGLHPGLWPRWSAELQTPGECPWRRRSCDKMLR